MSKISRKKLLKRIFIVIVAIFTVLILTLTILERCSEANKEIVYSYNPFDYISRAGYSEAEDNIFADEEYIEKNRNIRVEYEGDITEYDENSLQNASYSVKLLGNYFKYAINGDGSSLNTLFTDAYFENNGKTIEKYADRFAQQKIYRIRIKLVDGPYTQTDKGGSIKIERFEVSFMIMDNNGQFRPDLDEETAIPLVFEVLTQNYESHINSITKYNYSEQ